MLGEVIFTRSARTLLLFTELFKVIHIVIIILIIDLNVVMINVEPSVQVLLDRIWLIFDLKIRSLGAFELIDVHLLQGLVRWVL